MDKNEIFELVSMFGLYVDLDRWDEENYEWIRVQSLQYPEEFGYRNNCIIIYKFDTKEEILNQLQKSLIDLGRKIKISEIKDVLKL